MPEKFAHMMHYSRIFFFCFFLFSFVSSSGRINTPLSTSVYLDGSSEKKVSEAISKGMFILPMRIPPLLSGNFGELRSNHFHSGLDFKTQARTGIPVYAVADGWISRIRTSAYGFGFALYISHPNGYTSVYAHLSRYAAPFDSINIAGQYAKEQFELDTLYKPGVIPVRKGQLIAYSGNSGSSSAPHMHFEIRDSETEETIDPLLWYSGKIKDSLPPRVRSITVYAIENEGSLSNGNNKKSVTTVRTANGVWQLSDSLPLVWGKIGLGIKAYDYMDNTNNIYGLCKIKLFMDDKEIFSQDISRFAFSNTRYINSLVDYEDWLRQRSLTMKSFIEPGNNLPIYGHNVDRGYITINDEAVHNFRYELTDRAGNMAEVRFTLKGRKQAIPQTESPGLLMEYLYPNHFAVRDAVIDIPAGALYNNIHFTFSQEASDSYSDIYTLHKEYTPLHRSIQIRLKIQNDILPEKNSYYLARQNRSGKYLSVGGSYDKGWIEANVRDFGKFTVMADTVPPKIIPINFENAVKNRLFRIRITDNATGIQSYRGTIDGKWALFEYDMKKAQLKYKFDNSRLKRDQQHTLQLNVKDVCGNESKFEHKFYY